MSAKRAISTLCTNNNITSITTAAAAAAVTTATNNNTSTATTKTSTSSTRAGTNNVNFIAGINTATNNTSSITNTSAVASSATRPPSRVSKLFDEQQYRTLVIENSIACQNCNCTTGTNLKHCWACRALMCRTSCRSSRRDDANIDDDNYPVNNNNTRKQKERYHLDIVTLHSKFITREQLLKKFTETTIVQDCYSNLIQFIRGIDLCKDLFTIISPMNNKARFNWQSLQPTRMMFGETKNRNNNHTNTVSRATYAKQ